jgi:acetyl-CoA synthetase
MINKPPEFFSQDRDNYAPLHSRFQWHVPDRFNMAQVCCARWAAMKGAAEKVAILEYPPASGAPVSYSYSALQRRANRLSNLLVRQGVKRGDRVAIVMPQRFETAVAYIAVLQTGAVAMPLSMLFGPDALEFRLLDSEAVLAICDDTVADSLKAARANCPQLRCVLSMAAICASSPGPSDDFDLVDTLADEAAVLIYTSGTTGPPKGALIPHRALIGNLTGFVCSQNWFGFDGVSNAQSNAVFWSPADWAWTGGLMDALLPTLYFGRPIVAFNGRFSPEVALVLMGDCGVTHTFLFPTALKAMMKAFPGGRESTVRDQFNLQLQAIMSAGEAVGDAVFEYCQRQLGIQVNEMFGQTEINYIVGNCVAQWPPKPGSMGKAYPGHRVMVIDDEGRECAVGVPGDVAVNRFDAHGYPDPVFFLGYWKNKAATHAKFTADWCRTGDMATRDADGYLWYQGRADDVFKAAGYRIGPGEVENCLVKHPAVANAAVVPKPDAQRGAVVKAYVVLSPDFIAMRANSTVASALFDQELILQLQAHVKGKLAPYEYPKEIEFVDALPMTTTGKVQRRVLRLQEEERARIAT